MRMPKATTQDAIPAQRTSSIDDEAVPRALRAVAAVVLLEAVIALGYGAYLLVEALVGTPRQFGQAVAVAVTVIVIAAPLPFVARGMARARMWSRTPSVMVQLLALWMAYFMVQVEAWPGAVPTILVAVGALVGIFLPDSTRALTRHWRRD